MGEVSDRLRRVERSLRRRAAYAGRRVECPCCRRRYRRFADHPRGRREAICPGCGSAERHRLLWRYLEQNAALLAPGRSILHFAPEPGIERALRLREGIDYVTADLDPDAAAVTADITALPFDDAMFDLVLCSHVLEHVPDDRTALAEIRRVLKPGGEALLMHPIDYRRETVEDPSITAPEARLRAFGQEDHVRLYGRDFIGRVLDCGFEVRLERYSEEVPAKVAQRQRLLTVPTVPGVYADDIYRCRRPATDTRVVAD